MYQGGDRHLRCPCGGFDAHALHKINWQRNKKPFQYEFEGKTRKYYPDFYLIDEDCYIEIKGFKTKKDDAKWISFPEKLKILYGKDLKN